jgi:hypothetical protein
MGRFGLAMRVLFSGKFAQEINAALSSGTPKIEEKKAASKPVDPPKPEPVRNDAVSLLATLQREARLIDFLKEDITAYDDAQVGAAVRDIHRESNKVLDRLFAFKAVVDQEDGTQVDVPKEPAGRYQLVGNVGEQKPSRGTLVHPGWQATKCELPIWNGSAKAAMIVAPAEVEV